MIFKVGKMYIWKFNSPETLPNMQCYILETPIHSPQILRIKPNEPFVVLKIKWLSGKVFDDMTHNVDIKVLTFDGIIGWIRPVKDDVFVGVGITNKELSANG